MNELETIKEFSAVLSSYFAELLNCGHFFKNKDRKTL